MSWKLTWKSAFDYQKCNSFLGLRPPGPPQRALPLDPNGDLRRPRNPPPHGQLLTWPCFSAFTDFSHLEAWISSEVLVVLLQQVVLLGSSGPLLMGHYSNNGRPSLITTNIYQNRKYIGRWTWLRLCSPAWSPQKSDNVFSWVSAHIYGFNIGAPFECAAIQLTLREVLWQRVGEFLLENIIALCLFVYDQWAFATKETGTRWSTFIS